MAEQGALTLTWRTPAAPWAVYRIIVDGVDLGPVRYRKPVTVTLPVGSHDVVLGCRSYRSAAVRVDIGRGESLDLFGSTRLPPAGMGRAELASWARDNSIWLGVAEKAPTSPDTRPYSASRLWLHLAIAVLFGAFTLITLSHHHWWAAVLAFTFVAVGVGLARQDLARRRVAR